MTGTLSPNTTGDSCAVSTTLWWRPQAARRVGLWLTPRVSLLWRRSWPDTEVMVERWDLWAMHNH